MIQELYGHMELFEWNQLAFDASTSGDGLMLTKVQPPKCKECKKCNFFWRQFQHFFSKKCVECSIWEAEWMLLWSSWTPAEFPAYAKGRVRSVCARCLFDLSDGLAKLSLAKTWNPRLKDSSFFRFSSALEESDPFRAEDKSLWKRKLFFAKLCP